MPHLGAFPLGRDAFPSRCPEARPPCRPLWPASETHPGPAPGKHPDPLLQASSARTPCNQPAQGLNPSTPLATREPFRSRNRLCFLPAGSLRLKSVRHRTGLGKPRSDERTKTEGGARRALHSHGTVGRGVDSRRHPGVQCVDPKQRDKGERGGRERRAGAAGGTGAGGREERMGDKLAPERGQSVYLRSLPRNLGLSERALCTQPREALWPPASGRQLPGVSR